MTDFDGRTQTKFGGYALLFGTLVAAAAFAACGSDAPESIFQSTPDASVPDPTKPDPGFGDASVFDQSNVLSIAFDPPAATVSVDGVTPQTASYSLKATMRNGSVVPVMAQSLQFDRPDLAKYTSANPVVLTANGPYAGTGSIHAVFAGKTAVATLKVLVHIKDVGAGVDPTAVSALSAAGLAADPSVTSLLYPYDHTVFPLGLGSPLVMWNAPQANDVYRLHYEQTDYSYDGFFVVGATGQLRAAQDKWDHLTASNAGDPIQASLSRWDATSHVAYASAKQSWPISPASLRGAIYYWTTSAGGHMSRIRPGSGTAPEILNGGKCMGCHAVSADGTTLVASVEDQPSVNPNPRDGNKRAWVSFDLPGEAVRGTSQRFAANLAVNPNGKYVVYGTQTLHLGDAATGLEIAGSGLDLFPLDTGMKGFMTPAFSPNGKKLAMVEGNGSWYHNLIDGKLVVADFDESTKHFSGLTSLAAASSFPAGERAIAYPTFTPDSQLVSFHVGDYATGCDVQGCNDAATQKGALWIQNVSGAAPVRLATLTDSSASLTDHDISFEPTFNPVERGGFFWMVFTSSRDWGNKIVGTANNGKKRLWVAAIDKATGTVDPSHPAFFLEGQEEATTNMRGFWALAACTPTAGGGSCGAGFECCSGFCDAGVCIDVSEVKCKAVGDACTTAADCCNPDVVTCSAGKCTVPIK